MEAGNTKHNIVRATCAQLVAAFAFNLLSLNAGIIITMPTLVIGALRVHSQSLPLSKEQASWLVGIIFMVQPVGSVLSAFLQDRIGRKACMMVVNIPQLAAWFMMYYATGFSALLVAMTFIGLSIGFMEAPVLSYVGEMSEPRLRGVLSTFHMVFFSIGHLLEVFLGAVVDWRTMVLLNAAGPVAAFLSLSLVPDSPAWLVTKGRIKDAEKAYQWLRGWVSAPSVSEELEAMVSHVQKKRKPRIVSGEQYTAVSTAEGAVNPAIGQEPMESMVKMFLHPSVLRPFRLIYIYFVVGACACMLPFRMYLIEILSVIELPITPNKFLIVSSFLTLFGTVTSTLSIRRMGKRGLTFLSMGLCSVCTLGIGSYLRIDAHYPWLLLGLLATSYYAAALALLCVPWMLVTELFPLKGRGLAGGVTAAVAYFMMFLFVKTYYNVTSVLSLSGTCLLYGVIGLCGVVYMYFYLPETEGIPLEVVEKLYRENSSQVVSAARRLRKEVNSRKDKECTPCQSDDL